MDTRNISLKLVTRVGLGRPNDRCSTVLELTKQYAVGFVVETRAECYEPTKYSGNEFASWKLFRGLCCCLLGFETVFFQIIFINML